MPKYCCVPKCFSRSDNIKCDQILLVKYQQEVSFDLIHSRSYHIPRTDIIQKIWLERINAKDVTKSRHPGMRVICQKHFDKNCFQANGKLIKGSLPTLNSPEYCADRNKEDFPSSKTEDEVIEWEDIPEESQSMHPSIEDINFQQLDVPEESPSVTSMQSISQTTTGQNRMTPSKKAHKKTLSHEETFP